MSEMSESAPRKTEEVMAETREQFEKWAKENAGLMPLSRREDGSYSWPHATYAWQGWQAALASQVPAAPEPTATAGSQPDLTITVSQGGYNRNSGSIWPESTASAAPQTIKSQRIDEFLAGHASYCELQKMPRTICTSDAMFGPPMPLLSCTCNKAAPEKEKEKE